ncbi:MAG: hypothetical protein QF551_06080 [Candidatus Marinimicrobia bacterium]|jgi:hypothetical protein|nr:hypothetical protein [Candidatus Neomarinimicrobiota bacterium]MDP6835615.1 hypothetical protein [Candidatus Neomarinimicrobiota bacterium]MDP6966821.1 hypothetical protein [Candidatus Neomarinimicrobiota bacterium]|tara:strand:+ start:127 stop:408 length:282 start_codon:yes stop_codon:yes gene_type:complete
MYSHLMIILTFLLVTGFIIQPLFSDSRKNPFAEGRREEALQLHKRNLYRQIKEAELEFEMGNLSDEDFSRTRSLLKEEASRVLAQIERLESAA